jgi:hypothetical protein
VHRALTGIPYGSIASVTLTATYSFTLAVAGALIVGADGVGTTARPAMTLHPSLGERPFGFTNVRSFD